MQIIRYKHRQKEGSWPKSGPPLHLGSWKWRETSPDYKGQIEDLFIPIIIPFTIIICIITKLRQINKGNVVVVQPLKNVIDQTIFDANSL